MAQSSLLLRVCDGERHYKHNRSRKRKRNQYQRHRVAADRAAHAVTLRRFGL